LGKINAVIWRAPVVDYRNAHRNKNKLMIHKARNFWSLLMEAAHEFSEDHASKLSASLAYYTLFSIGPLLLVVVTIVGFFYKKASAELFGEMSSIIGAKAAGQLQGMLDNMSKQTNTTLIGIIGILVFIFGATGIFAEMQSSINYIWSVKAKPKRSWLKYILDRLISLALVIGLGFLLLVTLFMNVAFDLFSEHLKQFLGNSDTALLKAANTGLLFIVAALIFTIIFKVLPDAWISWKDAIIGSVFTSVLFMVGKLLISYYLGISKSINLYGAATSIILLLSWVYYSAMIIYYGAEFTEVYAKKWGDGMVVKKNAVHLVKHEKVGLISRKKGSGPGG